MPTMKKQTVSIILGIGLSIAMASVGEAVPSLEMTSSKQVDWSRVINDPFDGKVVYDKHFDPGGSFNFVSRWSPQGIQATYTQYFSEVVGYRTVWRTKWITDRHKKRREISYPENEPVYRRYGRDRSPQAIKLAINGQVYTYENGAISPELATALVNAPAGNVRIRLVWEDGSTTDMEIGRGTVEAWKTVFAAVPKPIISESKP